MPFQHKSSIDMQSNIIDMCWGGGRGGEGGEAGNAAKPVTHQSS